MCNGYVHYGNVNGYDIYKLSYVFVHTVLFVHDDTWVKNIYAVNCNIYSSRLCYFCA